jgi:hypothetical protein
MDRFISNVLPESNPPETHSRTGYVVSAAAVRAKKIYRILSADEIEETFLVAPPGQDFALYTKAHLKRVK